MPNELSGVEWYLEPTGSGFNRFFVKDAATAITVKLTFW